MPPASRAGILLGLLGLLGLAPRAGHAADPHDRVLGLPYALKVAAPVLFLPRALDAPADVIPGTVVLAALGVPSVFVLQGVHGGDARKTRRWRRVAYAADLGVAAGLTGWGLWTIHRAKRAQREAVREDRDPDARGPDPIAGGYRVVAALPLLLAAQLDLIPFRLEGAGGAERTALRLRPHGRGACSGAAIELAAAF